MNTNDYSEVEFTFSATFEEIEEIFTCAVFANYGDTALTVASELACQIAEEIFSCDAGKVLIVNIA